MGDDQPDIRVFPLDLHELRNVERIPQPRRPGDMQHDDPAVPVRGFQMLMGQEIENADLLFRNIGRAVAQVGFEPQKAALPDFRFEKIGRHVVCRAEQGGKAIDLRGFPDIGVALPHVVGNAAENQGRDGLAGKEGPEAAGQILRRLFVRDQVDPGGSAVGLSLRPEGVFPDMGVDIDQIVRQKPPQFRLVHAAVIVGQIQLKHGMTPLVLPQRGKCRGLVPIQPGRDARDHRGAHRSGV